MQAAVLAAFAARGADGVIDICVGHVPKLQATGAALHGE